MATISWSGVTAAVQTGYTRFSLARRPPLPPLAHTPFLLPLPTGLLRASESLVSSLHQDIGWQMEGAQ